MRFKEYLKKEYLEEAPDPKLKKAMADLNRELDDVLREFTKLTNQIESSAKIKKGLAVIRSQDRILGNQLQSMIIGLALPLKAKDLGFQARLKTIKGILKFIK